MKQNKPLELTKRYIAEKNRILIISHVYPFPGEAGQERRVYFTLRSLRKHFHITFLTYAPSQLIEATVSKLSETCDEVICMNSIYAASVYSRIFYRSMAACVSALSSLKPSNYLLGKVELSPKRVAHAIGDRKFDVVLYEYWHAHWTTEIFRKRGIPSILDMHNILWRSFKEQLQQRSFWPLSGVRNKRLKAYKEHEENVWKKFDGIISINRVEDEYVRSRGENEQKVFYAPMGIETDVWKYSWDPDRNCSKIAYYGGLGSPHNEASAWDCFEKVMPAVWLQFPQAEFWVIGSNPSPRLCSLPSMDGRVKVTGYIKDVRSALAQMSVVVCPWQGKYGFRSRLVEVMAIGVPVVTTSDAIDGMDLEDKADVLIGDGDQDLIRHTLALLIDDRRADKQSKKARRTVENLYSVEQTYDRLSDELLAWLSSRGER